MSTLRLKFEPNRTMALENMFGDALKIAQNEAKNFAGDYDYVQVRFEYRWSLADPITFVVTPSSALEHFLKAKGAIHTTLCPNQVVHINGKGDEEAYKLVTLPVAP